MITVRKSDQRGYADHGWLKTHHTFSFADYHDREHMGFKSLRVINEDFVAPGQGFGTHPHRDMEIITYVLDGELEHKDSMGTGSIIKPGEVQYMSAGKGVLHSEFNPSKENPVHLMQIWIQPNAKGLAPMYAQKSFPVNENKGKLVRVVSGSDKDGAIKIRQDAELFVSKLSSGDSIEYPVSKGRSLWLQIARGSGSVNGEDFNPGDGVALSDEEICKIAANSDTELLLFDLA